MNKPCKQRFKGVETFLRRVAYNLGNTPSQTEVKIISCIPIDVTDLQKRIHFLERQLQETSKHNENAPQKLMSPPPKPAAMSTSERVISDKGGNQSGAVGDKNGAIDDKDGAISNKINKPNTGGTVVNTILQGGFYANQSQTVGYPSDNSLRSDKSRPKTGNSSKHRKSNVSFALPFIGTMSKDEHPSYSSHENDDPDNAIRNIAEIENKLGAAERYYSNLFKRHKRKKKQCKRKSKQKTQLIYFAQNTQNNPFNALAPFETLNNNTVTVSHAYLDNILRKQYDPKFVIQEFSDTSYFSRPVCRDTTEKLGLSRLHESDVCSCCHGRFQNIDDYIPKGFDSINNIMQYEPNYTNKTYYDSNLYDIVPVKENTNKFLKESNSPKKDVEIRCWPEQFRSKYRYDPKIVKYQPESPRKRHDNFTVQIINRKEKSEQHNVKQTRANNQVHKTSKVTPKRCYIGRSDINKNLNETLPLAKVKKYEPVISVLKNELIGTDDSINTKLLKNQSTQLELIPDDNKTELTLNQIKSILQSVLAEVKTNTKVNCSIEKTPKRDAVVQKGSSQNNMQGQSTLLHSFTYNNSYNANPYLPSYSQQFSAYQPYQHSMKYLQNFPVFIHPSSRRHLCACYYKKSSHKSSKYNQVLTAATNTDKEIAREINNNAGTKETEKLINEIYKSMAMTMDFPTKDNSASECDDFKSSENDLKGNIKEVKSAGIKVIDKRDVEVEAFISSTVSNNSNVVNNTTSTQPEDKVRPYESNNSTRNETNHDQMLHGFKDHSTDTIIEDAEETDVSSEGTEDEGIMDINEVETLVIPKHEKKGLLRRMFNSVKMFKKRKEDQKMNESDEASEASDSDDYETIYSGRTAALQPRDRRQAYKYQDSSKEKSADRNAFIRSLHEKGRTPYLEQEYRRQWNERLMFNKPQERKYSSERPLSKQSSRKDARPAYWNNYEARSAIVDNSSPSPLHYVNSIAKVSKLKRDSLDGIKDGAAKDKLPWLKKHRVANCGEQWKKFILEN